VKYFPYYPKLDLRGTMFKAGRILVEREEEPEEMIC